MGRESDAMMDYLKNNERFADLFNGSFFQGEEVVRAEVLTEGSEVYKENYLKWRAAESGTEEQEKVKLTVEDASIVRTRDVKKRLQSGGSLKVLAVEDQNLVNFIMPWRTMNYDALEYGEQIRVLKAHNKKGKKLNTPAQRMCGLTEEDRLVPCFTVCLYHGKDKWNGPRSLKDMMDFGEEDALWEKLFSDYQMQLICLNEMEDFSCFHSPLKELFTLLSCRRDKKGLQKLLKEDPAYREMDGETAQVAGILMGVKDFMGEKKFVKEEKYDMCEAIQEMMNDSWQGGIECGIKQGLERGIERGIEQGMERGLEKGIKMFILDNLEEGFDREYIMKKLSRRFEVTEEQAKEYYEKYGNDSAVQQN